MTSEEDWGAAVEAALSQYGRLDVLVNIPGARDPESILETDTDHWQLVKH